MSEPREISVVIPARNAEAWIVECLDALLHQQKDLLEILLIDDGSTDATAARAREAGGELLHVLQGGGRGASHARNVGTVAARGDFILYMDADDVLGPQRLGDRVAAMKESDADVAYCDWQRYDPSSDGRFVKGEIVARTVGPRPEIALFTDHWWPPGSLLYRRRIVDRIGPWRMDLPIIQDARFLLDAALRGGSFLHCAGVGCLYRESGAHSLSRRDPRAFLRDVYWNACDVHRFWRTQGALDSSRRSAVLGLYSYVARTAVEIDVELSKRARLRLRAMGHRFLSGSSLHVRAATALLGYERAKAVGRWLRGTSASSGRP